MSIAQSILDIVRDEAQKHKLSEVRVIRLQVGAMAAVVPESLRFCFELMRRDTVASRAELEIETVPLTARCSNCGEVFEVENYCFVCVRCGDPVVDVTGGRELNLLTIEGEGEDGGD